MVRRYLPGEPQMANWPCGQMLGTDVTSALERSRVGDHQGRSAHRYGSLDLDHAGALTASVGHPAGSGNGPVRPGHLRSRKVPGRWHAPRTPESAAGCPWWKSKTWHVLVLSLCIAIFTLCVAILIGVR